MRKIPQPSRIALLIASIFPIILFLNRFLLPDTSFDTINYHLFLGQRGLHNFFWPFGPNEFYPSGIFTFAPFYDIMSYLSYLTVGYRLGTITSLIAYLVLIYFVYKLIKLYRPIFMRSYSLIDVLLLINAIVVTELFLEVATYLQEVTNTALVIAALYYLLRGVKSVLEETDQAQPSKDFVIGSVLFGLALFGKMTNFVFLIPLLGLLFWLFVVKRRQQGGLKRSVGLFILCVCLMIGPFGIFSSINFIKTGNPFFPFFNGVFASPYYSHLSFANSFWGGRTLTEKLVWPLSSVFEAKRLGEMHDQFNDYKLQFYTLVMLIFAIVSLKKKFLTTFELASGICFFIAIELWSLAFGYLRYATAIEVFGSILFTILILKLLQRSRLRYGTIAVVLGLTLVNILSFKFNLHFDYSWRPGFINNQDLYKSQIHSLFTRQIPIDPNLANQTDITINCVHPSASYYMLTNLQNKPVVLLDTISGAGFLDNLAYQQKVKAALTQAFPKQTILTFTALTVSDGPNPTAEQCRTNLATYNFVTTNSTVIHGFLGDPGQTFTLFTGKYPLGW